MGSNRYLIALGSNVRHHRHGRPDHVLRRAVDKLESEGLSIEFVSGIYVSAPLGPSRRCYANNAAVLGTHLEPEELLDLLHDIECQFGKRRGGQRWSARVLDLDIVLWDRGIYAANGLIVPHPQFRLRDFVLRPSLEVAADWRDPLTGLTIRQLHARLTRPRAAPR
ncbi:MAG: 2-amino-4-hydroxy-6-hydroxymethyldihydropteridine diphosphokinase [Novosphingobium sp.]|nr:2-amino-4-hydroxy-6-hydroxymethyldihydropteridine diphosphokinase [Novosphingobium sp.]